MRDPLSALKGGGRIVRGSVSGTGAITSGTGFTVTRLGVGNYRINFLQPFNAYPDSVATLYQPGVSRQIRVNLPSTPFNLYINTYDPIAVTDVDEQFFFIAMEQER